ncbi:MAG: potassium channel family protein [Pseudomonadota bacterium]
MRHFWRNLPAALGVAGVASHEGAAVRRWAVRLEIPVALATLWLPFAWYAEAKGLIDGPTLRMLDLMVWGVFLIEAVILSLIVRNRGLYWRQNWLNLAIVIGGLPLLFMDSEASLAFLRVLRLILLVVVLIRVARRSLRMMARHALAATLVIAVFLIGSLGTLVATIEPKYESIWDGLWWAVVTISTVGYGDLVPVTAEGRLLGAVLIVFGVLTFSMVMANVAAALVGLQVEESSAEMEREEIRHELLILQRLEAMEERFDRLERLLAGQSNDRRSHGG